MKRHSEQNDTAQHVGMVETKKKLGLKPNEKLAHIEIHRWGEDILNIDSENWSKLSEDEYASAIDTLYMSADTKRIDLVGDIISHCSQEYFDAYVDLIDADELLELKKDITSFEENMPVKSTAHTRINKAAEGKCDPDALFALKN